jgi:hypothetical protein
MIEFTLKLTLVPEAGNLPRRLPDLRDQLERHLQTFIIVSDESILPEKKQISFYVNPSMKQVSHNH